MAKKIDLFEALKAYELAGKDVIRAISQLKDERVENDQLDFGQNAGQMPPSFMRLDGGHLDILSKLEGNAFNSVSLTVAYMGAFEPRSIIRPVH